MSTVTFVAGVNIAVIKYWGKADEKLLLPTNDSISVTLDNEQLCAKTTVMISPDFKEDFMWLNGQKEDIAKPRLQNCLTEIRKRAECPDNMKLWKVHICSENNFPTAAGLASSAAGFACLVAALAKLYKVKGDISAIARIGSGSACRSVLGGFVQWSMGSKPNGEDSIATQIAPESHWPEMRAIILVINDAKKKISSTFAMRRTMETSDLIKHRIKYTVPDRVPIMQNAIIEKNFRTFAEHTMKDSNQMHAVCLDSYPPCFYLNDISLAVIDFVHSYNDAIGVSKVAYTFDAGPNATLFLLEEAVPEFVGLLDHFFPPSETDSIAYRKGLPVDPVKPSQDLLHKINAVKQSPGCLKYMIYTKVGSGPKCLEGSGNHLLNDQGVPVSQA